MIFPDLNPGEPAFYALLIFGTLPILFNLPPFFAHRKSSITLALWFVPLFLYIVFITYFTITNPYFYWSFRGDFLIFSMSISLLNLLIITLIRERIPGD